MEHKNSETNAAGIKRKITEMLDKNSDEKLLNRIYRFIKYIYIKSLSQNKTEYDIM